MYIAWDTDVGVVLFKYGGKSSNHGEELFIS